AGVADGGDAEFPDEAEDVRAQALGVRGGAARFEDAGVHAAAQVFDERSEEAGVHFAHGEGGVQGETGGAHGDPFLCSVYRMTLATSNVTVRGMSGHVNETGVIRTGPCLVHALA